MTNWGWGEFHDSLPPVLLSGLKRKQFFQPSDVQALVCKLKKQKGLLVQAPSGSGKTVAFAIELLKDTNTSDAFHYGYDGILQPMPQNFPLVGDLPIPQRLQHVVLCPSREVALQVGTEILDLGFDDEKLRVLTLVGGAPLFVDQFSLRVVRPQIVVATPGRLLSLLQDESSHAMQRTSREQRQKRRRITKITISKQRFEFPSKMKTLVIDEADKLLDETFARQTAAIVGRASSCRLLFFSATFPPQILAQAEKLFCSFHKNINVSFESADPGEPNETNEGGEDGDLNVLVEAFLSSSYLRHDEKSSSYLVPLRMSSSAEPNLSQTVAIKPPIDVSKIRILAISVDRSLDQFLKLLRHLFPLKKLDMDDKIDRYSKLWKWGDAIEAFHHWPDLLSKFCLTVACLEAFDSDIETLSEDLNLNEDLNGFNSQFIIFCNDSFSGRLIAQTLTSRMGVPAKYVSAQVTSNERMIALKEFKEDQKLKVLICSDLLARGLNAPSVRCVISVDLPDETSTFLHRIGRTGRYGEVGDSVCLLDHTQEFQTFEYFVKQANVDVTYLSALG